MTLVQQKNLEGLSQLRLIRTGGYIAGATGGLNLGGIFTNYEKVLRLRIDDITTGYIVEGTGPLYSVFDHEFGHRLQDYILCGMTEEKEAEMVRDMTHSLVGKKGMSIYPLAFDEPEASAEYEIFAVGFAAWYGGENSEFAQAFGEFLKR